MEGVGYLGRLVFYWTAVPEGSGGLICLGSVAMPIYEYHCSHCGKFETIQKFSDQPLSDCPHCALKGIVSKVEKLVSAAAFHLKGSGWYKTDYASSKVSKDSESSKETKVDGSDSEKPALDSSDKGEAKALADKKTPASESAAVAG